MSDVSGVTSYVQAVLEEELRDTDESSMRQRLEEKLTEFIEDGPCLPPVQRCLAPVIMSQQPLIIPVL